MNLAASDMMLSVVCMPPTLGKSWFLLIFKIFSSFNGDELLDVRECYVQSFGLFAT